MDTISPLSKKKSLDIFFREHNISKYVLGTAQLGQSYGIANRDGVPDRDRSRAIVMNAWGAGARCFDTAQGYGRSEAVLGQALSDSGISHDTLVITKLRSDHDPSSPEWVASSVMDSLQYLNITSLFGVMLHRYDWIQYLDGTLGDELRQLRDQGLIRYLGISVYTVEEVVTALEHPDVDIVQAPCNLWNPELYLDEIF
ncbi:MAG: aldo/keto reductase [Euryarchaeota archaeon]|nr:aldo/keto reductase [Euryarchaeota archaeon]